MNEYKGKGGADRQYWSALWAQASTIVNGKELPGPLYIFRPTVSVVGGVPPDMLDEFPDDRGREDGFIHRILFSFPERTRAEWRDEGVSLETREQYWEFYKDLRSLRLSNIGDILELRLSPAAQQVFAEWAQEHYREMDDGLIHLRGPWAKMISYCARFILVSHQAKFIAGEVEDEFKVGVESVHATENSQNTSRPMHARSTTA